jgi:hypothetical protein
MALNILLLSDVTKRRDMLVVWEQSQQVEVYDTLPEVG